MATTTLDLTVRLRADGVSNFEFVKLTEEYKKKLMALNPKIVVQFGYYDDDENFIKEEETNEIECTMTEVRAEEVEFRYVGGW
mgnify:CR=1 FL=1